MKDSPFQSSYLADFTVHEEQQGKRRLYPSTAELPLLARALKLEFESMLPPKIIRADHRATDLEKIQKKVAVDLFCHLVNGSRLDRLQLFGLLDHDRVAHVSIVQQITTHTPIGASHQFRFYASPDFSTEIFLSGRRFVFSDHALNQFSSRGPGFTSNKLRNFLATVFSTAFIALPCGGHHGAGLFVPFEESVIALPFREGEGEFFIPTFLGVNEVHTLELGLPAYALNLHYGPDFTNPKIRNWDPVGCMANVKRIWERKNPLPARELEDEGARWGAIAPTIRDRVVRRPWCWFSSAVHRQHPGALQH